MKISFLLIFFITVVSVQSQNVSIEYPVAFNERALGTESLKEFTLELHTVLVYPNPLSGNRLHVRPLGVTVYSYLVTKSTGEIVEIENLIGRDDFDVIFLNGVLPGLYFITFETNYGNITKSFVKT